jgi:hypothetical protein
MLAVEWSNCRAAAESDAVETGSSLSLKTIEKPVVKLYSQTRRAVLSSGLRLFLAIWTRRGTLVAAVHQRYG